MDKGLRNLIIFLSISIGATILYILFAKGILYMPEFATIGNDADDNSVVTSADDLKDGCYYVWHSNKPGNIKSDLWGTTSTGFFKKCPAGIINWSDNQWIDHTVWFPFMEDKTIPTLYPGDKLVYISSTAIPFEGIKWERFADYGFTIGIANMKKDASGHYRISFDSDNGYAGYLCPGSDAVELEKYTTVSELFIDKVGEADVREENVSDGGTVLGLLQNQYYNCQWYTGSYYQDYRMQADIHVYSHLEEFTTYEYEFLHSNCISITLPNYLKTGCYYIDGIGMFRYLEAKDVSAWPGYWAFDEDIDWNDPIIIYNEDGFIEYDPTNPDFIRTDSDVGVSDDETEESLHETDEGISDEEVWEEIIVIGK